MDTSRFAKRGEVRSTICNISLDSITIFLYVIVILLSIAASVHLAFFAGSVRFPDLEDLPVKFVGNRTILQRKLWSCRGIIICEIVDAIFEDRPYREGMEAIDCGGIYQGLAAYNTSYFLTPVGGFLAKKGLVIPPPWLMEERDIERTFTFPHKWYWPSAVLGAIVVVLLAFLILSKGSERLPVEQLYKHIHRADLYFGYHVFGSAGSANVVLVSDHVRSDIVTLGWFSAVLRNHTKAYPVGCFEDEMTNLKVYRNSYVAVKIFFFLIGLPLILVRFAATIGSELVLQLEVLVRGNGARCGDLKISMSAERYKKLRNDLVPYESTQATLLRGSGLMVFETSVYPRTSRCPPSPSYKLFVTALGNVIQISLSDGEGEQQIDGPLSAEGEQERERPFSAFEEREKAIQNLQKVAYSVNQLHFVSRLLISAYTTGVIRFFVQTAYGVSPYSTIPRGGDNVSEIAAITLVIFGTAYTVLGEYEPIRKLDREISEKLICQLKQENDDPGIGREEDSSPGDLEGGQSSSTTAEP